jgi:hypothetical protein
VLRPVAERAAGDQEAGAEGVVMGAGGHGSRPLRMARAMKALAYSTPISHSVSCA